MFPETPGAVKADGSSGGRGFELVEVIDLARDGEVGRLRSELGLS